MNISSKNGDVVLSGTDVKVENDLNLNAKNITIEAGKEEYSSSNSSSQTGIKVGLDLETGKIADVSFSKVGANGRGTGTDYINSTVEVE